MREHEKAEAYTAAIDILVTEAVTQAQPKTPGAYSAKVRADLSKRHRVKARQLFSEHGELSGADLALLLSNPPPPAPTPINNRDSRTPEPTYTAGEWKPLDPETRQQARERLAAIRADLKARVSA